MIQADVAVVSDAVSADFYFPAWHRYYSGLFGAENIHLITYQGRRDAFDEFILGDLVVLEDAYSDTGRLVAVTRLVDRLLTEYKTIIRVDTDEFLVPDPVSYKDLRAFAEQRTSEVVCARGFDVFQKIGEPALDYTRSMLCTQRRHAFAVTSLHKPCVTSVPIRWNTGFHYSSVPPHFDRLFMFHMKRADIKSQQIWNDHMVDSATDTDVKAYYRSSGERIEDFHRSMSVRETLNEENALYREDFVEDFLASMKLWQSDRIYHGKFAIDTVNVEIPLRFSGYF